MTIPKNTSSFKYLLGHFFLLLGLVAIDQVTKFYAIQEFHSQVVMNAGIVGGLFHQSNAMIRTMLVLNFLLILSVFYLFSVFFFFRSKLFLSSLISVLYAAILSNSMDRIRLDGVVDFIQITTQQSGVGIVMNVADLLQQVSILGIIIYICIYQKKIWPEDNLRRVLLVDRQVQLSMSLFFAVLSFVTTLGSSLISYIYFKSVYPQISTELNEILLLSGLSSFLIAGVVFVFSLFYSLKFVGPIQALKRYFIDQQSGIKRPFSLRKGDYFRDLEKFINKD